MTLIATTSAKPAPTHANICRQVHRLLEIDRDKIEDDSALMAIHALLDSYIALQDCTLDEAVSAFADMVLGKETWPGKLGLRVYDFEDGTFRVEYVHDDDSLWVSAGEVFSEAKAMRHRRRRKPEWWVESDWMLVDDGYGNYVSRQARDAQEEAHAAWR